MSMSDYYCTDLGRHHGSKCTCGFTLLALGLLLDFEGCCWTSKVSVLPLQFCPKKSGLLLFNPSFCFTTPFCLTKCGLLLCHPILSNKMWVAVVPPHSVQQDVGCCCATPFCPTKCGLLLYPGFCFTIPGRYGWFRFTIQILG